MPPVDRSLALFYNLLAFQKLFEEDKGFFTAADLDHDGKLNREEFAAFQNPESHPHMHDSLIDSNLKDKDKNGDGFIDLQEFLGEYGKKAFVALGKQHSWVSTKDCFE